MLTFLKIREILATTPINKRFKELKIKIKWIICLKAAELLSLLSLSWVGNKSVIADCVYFYRTQCWKEAIFYQWIYCSRTKYSNIEFCVFISSELMHHQLRLHSFCASNYFVTPTFRIVKMTLSTPVIIFINLCIYSLCLQVKDEGPLRPGLFASIVTVASHVSNIEQCELNLQWEYPKRVFKLCKLLVSVLLPYLAQTGSRIKPNIFSCIGKAG